MAGHSKWANIKHKKAKEDSKRGKAFTRLTKEITVCARVGGGDPAGNPRLRQLIEKARSINMPLENTQRAIKKGTGELPGVQYEAITYEGYAPNGVAVIIETLTDNRNRCIAELRHFFSSRGGSIGETGSVAWMFDRMGVIRGTTETLSEDDLLEALLDFDIKDLTKDENNVHIVCDAKALDQVKKASEAAGLKVESAELEWVAKTSIDLAEEQGQQTFNFLEDLDDQDDVQAVYSNLG